MTYDLVLNYATAIIGFLTASFSLMLPGWEEPSHSQEVSLGVTLIGGVLTASSAIVLCIVA